MAQRCSKGTRWGHSPPVGVKAVLMRGKVRDRTEAQNKQVATAHDLLKCEPQVNMEEKEDHRTCPSPDASAGIPQQNT